MRFNNASEGSGRSHECQKTPLRGTSGAGSVRGGALFSRAGATPARVKGIDEETKPQQGEEKVESLEEGIPISRLQKTETGEHEEPLALSFKGRADDMMVAEKACMGKDNPTEPTTWRRLL